MICAMAELNASASQNHLSLAAAFDAPRAAAPSLFRTPRQRRVSHPSRRAAARRDDPPDGTPCSQTGSTLRCPARSTPGLSPAAPRTACTASPYPPHTFPPCPSRPPSCRATWTSPLRPSAPCLARSEEHTSELQSHSDLVCRLLLEKKKKQ